MIFIFKIKIKRRCRTNVDVQRKTCGHMWYSRVWVCDTRYHCVLARKEDWMRKAKTLKNFWKRLIELKEMKKDERKWRAGRGERWKFILELSRVWTNKMIWREAAWRIAKVECENEDDFVSQNDIKNDFLESLVIRSSALLLFFSSSVSVWIWFILTKIPLV